MAYTDDLLPSQLDAASALALLDVLVGQVDGETIVKKFSGTVVMAAILTLLGDTDAALAANSDSKLATQKATKAYVDANASGIQTKDSVVAATTANGVIATAFENGDTIDGVVLATGNRILLKNQTAGAENGIYTVNASGAPTRGTDADSSAELVNATVLVTGGTVNANRSYRQITPATITVGTTALAFALVNAGTADARTNTSSSVANEIALFADTAGKLLKRSTGSGYPLLTSGVLSVLTLADLATNLRGTGLTANALGRRILPRNSKSVDYTLVADDSAGFIFHPAADATARAWTIPSNASVAWENGTTLTFVNQTGAGAITIGITSDTLRNAVTGAAGPFSLAAGKLASALKIDDTEWLIA